MLGRLFIPSHPFWHPFINCSLLQNLTRHSMLILRRCFDKVIMLASKRWSNITQKHIAGMANKLSMLWATLQLRPVVIWRRFLGTRDIRNDEERIVWVVGLFALSNMTLLILFSQLWDWAVSRALTVLNEETRKNIVVLVIFARYKLSSGRYTIRKL